MRGVTRNLSETGMLVDVPELKKKAYVQLSFRLPRSEVIIDARGTVVWTLMRRHGIKFKHMGEQSRESIRQFIDERGCHSGYGQAVRATKGEFLK
jgi:hypothetical protein